MNEFWCNSLAHSDEPCCNKLHESSMHHQRPGRESAKRQNKQYEHVWHIDDDCQMIEYGVVTGTGQELQGGKYQHPAAGRSWEKQPALSVLTPWSLEATAWNCLDNLVFCVKLDLDFVPIPTEGPGAKRGWESHRYKKTIFAQIVAQTDSSDSAVSYCLSHAGKMELHEHPPVVSSSYHRFTVAGAQEVGKAGEAGEACWPQMWSPWGIHQSSKYHNSPANSRNDWRRIGEWKLICSLMIFQAGLEIFHDLFTGLYPPIHESLGAATVTFAIHIAVVYWIVCLHFDCCW